MKNVLVGIACGLALGLWSVAAAPQQEVRPTPGPGSGTMAVRGTVDIGRMPELAVSQRGLWQVAVTGAPPVTVSGPAFVNKGGRYTISWPSGEPETVTVLDPAQGGWLQVEFAANGGRRWVNAASARAIQEAR